MTSSRPKGQKGSTMNEQMDVAPDAVLTQAMIENGCQVGDLIETDTGEVLKVAALTPERADLEWVETKQS
jgi:hypothetical protein